MKKIILFLILTVFLLGCAKEPTTMPDTSAVQETPVQETQPPIQEAPIQETPQTPIQEVPVKPVQQPSIPETPQLPIQETPVVPIQETPVTQTMSHVELQDFSTGEIFSFNIGQVENLYQSPKGDATLAFEEPNRLKSKDNTGILRSAGSCASVDEKTEPPIYSYSIIVTAFNGFCYYVKTTTGDYAVMRIITMDNEKVVFEYKNLQ